MSRIDRAPEPGQPHGDAPIAVPPGAPPLPGARTPGASASLPRILLVEPQFVLRRTITAVGRDMGVAEVQEAISIEAAQPLLASQVYDGVVLDVGIDDRAVELLRRLRGGGFLSPAGTPVVCMLSPRAPAFTVERLVAFASLRILPRPFRVGELIKAMQQIWPRPTAAPALNPVAALPRSRLSAAQTPC